MVGLLFHSVLYISLAGSIYHCCYLDSNLLLANRCIPPQGLAMSVCMDTCLFTVGFSHRYRLLVVLHQDARILVLTKHQFLHSCADHMGHSPAHPSCMEKRYCMVGLHHCLFRYDAAIPGIPTSRVFQPPASSAIHRGTTISSAACIGTPYQLATSIQVGNRNRDIRYADRTLSYYLSAFVPRCKFPCRNPYASSCRGL